MRFWAYFEESSLTIVNQSNGSRFSGLISAQSLANFVESVERISDEAFSHLSLCQPFILEIREGGLDRRVLSFLLLFAKQCFVTIRKRRLSIPLASSLFTGFMTTSLEFTLGAGLKELGETFLSREKVEVEP
ncbi:MAG: hypothetical protein Ct9H90mP21_2470 [Methanobacteriota archaeon]|nr:MAG: hypothetical protein Ct9H90mP21_2470 [Euryarchaeota archaeon]